MQPINLVEQPLQLHELIVELSYNCNISCQMCGFGQHPIDRNKFMPWLLFKSLIDSVGHNARIVRLNGRGESTIHPQFSAMAAYVRKQLPEAQINLFSNLSFKSERILQTLIDCGMQLFVSMDSPVKAELEEIRTGARFDLIEHNLDLLERMEPRPFIIFTTQERNWHRLLDMAQYALGRNCHLLINTLRRDVGMEPFIRIIRENKTEIARQLQAMERLYANLGLSCHYPDQMAGVSLELDRAATTHASFEACPVLAHELCVLYDGTVTPCNMFNPYSYGNLWEQSLDDIVQGERYQAFWEGHKSHYYCKNCACLGVNQSA